MRHSATLRVQELFTALLIFAVADFAAPPSRTNGQQKTCDITIADVIGPLIDPTDEGKKAEFPDARDANFSLLSYSFSLV